MEIFLMENAYLSVKNTTFVSDLGIIDWGSHFLKSFILVAIYHYDFKQEKPVTIKIATT